MNVHCQAVTCSGLTLTRCLQSINSWSLRLLNWHVVTLEVLIPKRLIYKWGLEVVRLKNIVTYFAFILVWAL